MPLAAPASLQPALDGEAWGHSTEAATLILQTQRAFPAPGEMPRLALQGLAVGLRVLRPYVPDILAHLPLLSVELKAGSCQRGWHVICCLTFAPKGHWN